MENIKELVTQFGAKTKEADALLAQESLSQEDALKLDALNTERAELKAKVEAIHRIEGLRTQHRSLEQWASAPAAPALPHGGHPDVPALGRVLGFKPAGETHIERTAKGIEIVNTGAGVMRKDEWEATCREDYSAAWFRHLRVGWQGLSNGEQAILQEGIDNEGGYLAPTEVMNRVIAKEPTPTRIASMVSTFTTIRDSIALPKVNYTTDDLYTTGMRVTWTGEIPASATTHRATQPVFGQIRIPVYTAMISLPITRDLLEDSSVALQEWVTAKLTETIELLRDNMILNGTGTSQPSGILQSPGSTDEPATVVSGAAATLTADGFQTLAWSLPEQYDENARFVMNKTNTGQALAKLKDGDGRYLWGMGTQDSGLMPSIRNREILGYPVAFSGFMPNVGANAYPAIFGDLRGYFAVQRIGLSVEVLRELYAETNQVLILARVRFGGDVAEPWRMRIHKVAAS